MTLWLKVNVALGIEQHDVESSKIHCKMVYQLHQNTARFGFIYKQEVHWALWAMLDAWCAHQYHKGDHDGSNADTLCLQVPIAGDEWVNRIN